MSGRIGELIDRMPEGECEVNPAQPQQVVPWLVELFALWREQQEPTATIQALRTDIAQELSRRTGIFFVSRVVGRPPAEHDKLGRWLVHFGVVVLSREGRVGNLLLHDLDTFALHVDVWMRGSR